MGRDVNYTKALHKIAKENGLLDMAKVRSYVWTAKRIKQELAGIADYFNHQIPVIIGHDKAVEELYKICPEIPIERHDILPRVEKMDLSKMSGTILIVCDSVERSWGMEAALYNKNPACRICNVYEYLEMKGVNVKTAFYEYGRFSLTGKDPAGEKHFLYYFLMHLFSHETAQELLAHLCRQYDKRYPYFSWRRSREELFCTKKALASAAGDEKCFYLKKMMYLCILDRDILNLQNYAREYMELDHSDIGVRNFAASLDKLLQELKGKIQNNSREDVVIHWIDNLSNIRLREMPFLYGLSERADSSKSDMAFTCMPFTSWTLKTMFSGTRPVEGKLYKKQAFGKDEWLINELTERGYAFKFFGSRLLQHKHIHGKFEGVKIPHLRSMLSSAYIWEALNYMAKGRRKKAFILIQTLYESHPPFFSPDIDVLRYHQVSRDDMKKSLLWIDRQLEWYVRFLGEKSLQIWMGDHGANDLEPYSFKSERTNIPFFVRKNKKKIDFENGMFSLERFPKLIAYLLDWKSVPERDIFTDHVILEEFDWYDPGNVNDIIQDPATLSDKTKWMQFRAIRNSRALLVRFFDGERLFFALPDEETDLIDNPQYKDEVERMDQVLGDEFVDIYHEEMFVHSRKLYEEYQKQFGEGSV